MKRILLIGNGMSVFPNELTTQLRSLGHEVTLLDFSTLKMHSNEGVTTRWESLLNRVPNLLKVKMFIRLILLGRIIGSFRFYSINLHVPKWFYVLLYPVLKNRNYIVTFYGSDFYRAGFISRLLLVPLVRGASAITFTNPLLKSSFLDFYRGIDADYTHVCRFGLGALTAIDKNRNVDVNIIKAKLGYKPEKIIVTCGYNSTKEQQHRNIILALESLPSELIEKIQFIFPLTYGDSAYRNIVRKLLAKSKIDSLVLDEYLVGDDNAYIKIASDYMINVLETDSFSGSMQEFLYAGNTLIVGAWLPYSPLYSNGAYMEKVDACDQLADRLRQVIDEPISEGIKRGNRDSVMKLSHWSNVISCWERVLLG